MLIPFVGWVLFSANVAKGICHRGSGQIMRLASAAHPSRELSEGIVLRSKQIRPKYIGYLIGLCRANIASALITIQIFL
jgi:hypothetical protein